MFISKFRLLFCFLPLYWAQFTCQFCGYTCPMIVDGWSHLISHSGMIDPNYVGFVLPIGNPIPIGNPTTENGNLDLIFDPVTPPRPHLCQHEGCNKSFARLHYLKRHQKTHNPERTFTCEICGKSFYDRIDNLRAHVKLHETGSRINQRVSEVSETNKRNTENRPVGSSILRYDLLK